MQVFPFSTPSISTYSLRSSIIKHNKNIHDSDAINLLKPNLTKIIFKNSDFTTKETQLFTITKIKRLILFKKIIPVYNKNRGKPMNTKKKF
jgi:hypothetical protein